MMQIFLLRALVLGSALVLFSGVATATEPPHSGCEQELAAVAVTSCPPLEKSHTLSKIWGDSQPPFSISLKQIATLLLPCLVVTAQCT